jgi:hypothetical protein
LASVFGLVLCDSFLAYIHANGTNVRCYSFRDELFSLAFPARQDDVIFPGVLNAVKHVLEAVCEAIADAPTFYRDL